MRLPGWQQFFPQANPDHLLPNASFNGGIPSVNNNSIASFNSDNRWPFFGFNTLFNVSGNLTKVKGAHNIKTGLFVEHTTRPAQRASSYNGTISFNTDGSNPLNTNVGFANGLLGRDHAVPGVRRPPVGARPVHEHRVLRAGQLAR